MNNLGKHVLLDEHLISICSRQVTFIRRAFFAPVLSCKVGEDDEVSRYYHGRAMWMIQAVLLATTPHEVVINAHAVAVHQPLRCRALGQPFQPVRRLWYRYGIRSQILEFFFSHGAVAFNPVEVSVFIVGSANHCDRVAHCFVQVPVLLLVLFAAVDDGPTLAALQAGRLAAKTTGLRHRSNVLPACQTNLKLSFNEWSIAMGWSVTELEQINQYWECAWQGCSPLDLV